MTMLHSQRQPSTPCDVSCVHIMLPLLQANWRRHQLHQQQQLLKEQQLTAWAEEQYAAARAGRAAPVDDGGDGGSSSEESEETCSWKIRSKLALEEFVKPAKPVLQPFSRMVGREVPLNNTTSTKKWRGAVSGAMAASKLAAMAATAGNGGGGNGDADAAGEGGETAAGFAAVAFDGPRSTQQQQQQQTESITPGSAAPTGMPRCVCRGKGASARMEAGACLHYVKASTLVVQCKRLTGSQTARWCTLLKCLPVCASVSVALRPSSLSSSGGGGGSRISRTSSAAAAALAHMGSALLSNIASLLGTNRPRSSTGGNSIISINSTAPMAEHGHAAASSHSGSRNRSSSNAGGVGSGDGSSKTQGGLGKRLSMDLAALLGRHQTSSRVADVAAACRSSFYGPSTDLISSAGVQATQAAAADCSSSPASSATNALSKTHSSSKRRTSWWRSSSGSKDSSEGQQHPPPAAQPDRRGGMEEVTRNDSGDRRRGMEIARNSCGNDPPGAVVLTTQAQEIAAAPDIAARGAAAAAAYLQAASEALDRRQAVMTLCSAAALPVAPQQQEHPHSSSNSVDCSVLGDVSRSAPSAVQPEQDSSHTQSEGFQSSLVFAVSTAAAIVPQAAAAASSAEGFDSIWSIIQQPTPAADTAGDNKGRNGVSGAEQAPTPEPPLSLAVPVHRQLQQQQRAKAADEPQQCETVTPGSIAAAAVNPGRETSMGHSASQPQPPAKPKLLSQGEVAFQPSMPVLVTALDLSSSSSSNFNKQNSTNLTPPAASSTTSPSNSPAPQPPNEPLASSSSSSGRPGVRPNIRCIKFMRQGGVKPAGPLAAAAAASPAVVESPAAAETGPGDSTTASEAAAEASPMCIVPQVSSSSAAVAAAAPTAVRAWSAGRSTVSQKLAVARRMAATAATDGGGEDDGERGSGQATAGILNLQLDGSSSSKQRVAGTGGLAGPATAISSTSNSSSSIHAGASCLLPAVRDNKPRVRSADAGAHHVRPVPAVAGVRTAWSPELPLSHSRFSPPVSPKALSTHAATGNILAGRGCGSPTPMHGAQQQPINTTAAARAAGSLQAAGSGNAGGSRPEQHHAAPVKSRSDGLITSQPATGSSKGSRQVAAHGGPVCSATRGVTLLCGASAGLEPEDLLKQQQHHQQRRNSYSNDGSNPCSRKQGRIVQGTTGSNAAAGVSALGLAVGGGRLQPTLGAKTGGQMDARRSSVL